MSVVQWRMLVLIQAAAPITSSVLVKAVAMDAGLFSRNLKSLINDGLVLSRVDSNDHRQQVLRLSKRGLSQYERAAPFMQARRADLTNNVSVKDLNTFFAVLEKIENNASVAL